MNERMQDAFVSVCVAGTLWLYWSMLESVIQLVLEFFV